MPRCPDRSILRGRLAAAAALTSALALWACTATPRPVLDIVQPAGSALVSLSPAIQVKVANAQLDDVLLERLDDPAAPAPTVQVTAEGASLAGPLAPDARYRLVARAKALASAFQPPWDQTPPTIVEQERVFSTVRTPRLNAVGQPIVARRSEPVVVQFSEPLAQVQASAPVAVAAEIDAADARQVRLRFPELPAGEQFAVQLSGIVGREGAVRGPDAQVLVRTPEPPALLTISGTAVDDAVVVPAGTPLTLEWDRPLRSLRYRLDDKDTTWSGAPSTSVPLPVSLAQGESHTLLLLDAETADGGWLRAQESLAVRAPAALQLAAFWPADGAIGVTPKADPTFRFSEPVADRAAAEAAIHFTPAVPGRFEWLANNRVRFVPDEAFPRETPIQVEVKAGPTAARGQSGSYLTEPVSFSFQTGKLKVIDVALREQRMTLLEDGAAVWSAPVATGVKGAETPPGTYEVQYKMPIARFRGVNPNGSRYDIPDVRWVLAFYEDYTIHGAYWRTNFGRPGSNGCISLTDANAKHVFDWADVGTTVVVRS